MISDTIQCHFVVKNKTIIGLKYAHFSSGLPAGPVKNKTIIGLKFNNKNNSFIIFLVKNKTIIGLKYMVCESLNNHHS